MSYPGFERPSFNWFDYRTVRDRDQLRVAVIQAQETYDDFLHQILQPAQEYYAAFLETNETWHDELSPDEIDQLLEQFRSQPCMNDPTMLYNEIIARQPPEWLYVYVDVASAAAAMNQSLGDIAADFCFTDEHGRLRMLACDVPPWSPDFEPHVVTAGYRSLGCNEQMDYRRLTNCLVIPRTDVFRSEPEPAQPNVLSAIGGRFWSRPRYGPFDVVAVVAARGIL